MNPPASNADLQPVSPPIGAGALLSSIACLCAILVSVPFILMVYALAQTGLLSALFAPLAALKLVFLEFGTLLAFLKWPKPLTLAMIAPPSLLFLFALTYLIAFFRRSAWGPRMVSCLALCWAVSAAIGIVLVPMLAMSGGLPTFTILAMVPGMVAPILFALGFAGFLTTSTVAAHWFSRPRKERNP